MHVLGDYLKRRIAPLQQRPRPRRSYTGSNDCGRVQRGEEFDLTQEGLEVLVQGMTGEGFIPEHLILSPVIVADVADAQ